MSISIRCSLAILVVCLSLLGITTPALASEQPRSAEAALAFSIGAQQQSSILTIESIDPVVVGSHPTIVMRLTTSLGQPIPNQAIRVLVNDVRKAQVNTDTNGIATAVLRYKFDAGTYHIKAVYVGVGAIGLNAATAEADLTVEPSLVDIHTVPPIPGIRIQFNNQVYVTDESGTVKLQVNRSGVYSLEVLPADPTALPPNMRVEFSRWGDQVFTSYRESYFPRPKQLTLGLRISYEIDQVFYDAAGRPVDPSRVSSMTLRRYGELLTFDKAGPIWLAQNRVVGRLGGTLENQPILYYFKEIIVDGVNVVNKSQQRFHVGPDNVWPVNLLMYSVHFSGRDAMFNFPIGRGVELTYPNGRTQEFPFGSEDEILIPALARGTYLATVTGAWGSTPTTPIHMSRDQEVELRVLSYLDMAVIFGVPALIALAFLYIGRPHLFRGRRMIPAPAAFQTTK
jgi:hypothetical protein